MIYSNIGRKLLLGGRSVAALTAAFATAAVAVNTQYNYNSTVKLDTPKVEMPEMVDLGGGGNSEYSSVDLDTLDDIGDDDEPQKIQTPKPVKDMVGEINRCLNPHSFEGFQMQIQKGMTPTLLGVYVLMLGNPNAGPDAALAQYIAQLWFDEEGPADLNATSLNATLDTMGNGNITAKLRLNSAARVEIESRLMNPKLGMPDGTSCSLEGNGDSWYGALKLDLNDFSYTTDYIQAVTPYIDIGATSSFQPAKIKINPSLMARYHHDSKGVKILAQYSLNAGLKRIIYNRTVTPGRITLGADVHKSEQTGTYSSTIGAEVNLHQSRLVIATDLLSFKTKATLDSAVSSRVKLLLGAEVSPYKGSGGGDGAGGPEAATAMGGGGGGAEYKFGYGFQIA